MVTKEMKTEKICCFCASDFHLEMMLLPYIDKKIKDSKIIVMTENNLEETMKTLLDRVNFDNIKKENILNLNWKNNDFDKFREIKKNKTSEKIIIVNGDNNYIKNINQNMYKWISPNDTVIDCYNVENIKNENEIKNNYDKILNTLGENFIKTIDKI